MQKQISQLLEPVLRKILDRPIDYNSLKLIFVAIKTGDPVALKLFELCYERKLYPELIDGLICRMYKADKIQAIDKLANGSKVQRTLVLQRLESTSSQRYKGFRALSNMQVPPNALEFIVSIDPDWLPKLNIMQKLNMFNHLFLDEYIRVGVKDAYDAKNILLPNYPFLKRVSDKQMKKLLLPAMFQKPSLVKSILRANRKILASPLGGKYLSRWNHESFL